MARISLNSIHKKHWFILSSLALGACAPAFTGGVAQVNMRFIDGSSEITSPLSTGSTSGSSLATRKSNLTDASGKDIALSDEYCYAIMVSAADSPALNRYPDATNHDDGTGTDQNSLLCKKYQPTYIGQVSGLYKLGQDASLKVPTGKDRMFLMIMMKKGEDGIPATCSGVADVRYTKADDTNLYIDDKLLKNVNVKFLAGGTATLTTGTNTVDMRLINGTDGLECDGGDGDSNDLQTIPYTSKDGTLKISSDTAKPFVTVVCPKNVSKIVMIGNDNAYADSGTCESGTKTFVGLSPGKNYKISVFDSGGKEFSNLTRNFVVNVENSPNFNPLVDTTVNRNPVQITGGPTLHAIELRENALITASDQELKVNMASIVDLAQNSTYTNYNFAIVPDSAAKTVKYDKGYPSTPDLQTAHLAGYFNFSSALTLGIFGNSPSEYTPEFLSLGVSAIQGTDVSAVNKRIVVPTSQPFANSSLTNTAKMATIYSEVGTPTASPTIFPAVSPTAFLSTAPESISLPRPANPNFNRSPIFTRTDYDDVPMIIAPILATGGANKDVDEAQAEILIYRCTSTPATGTSGCLSGTSGISFSRLQFHDDELSVLTNYQVAPYYRSNSNTSETRLAFAHVTQNKYVIANSVSLKNLTYGSEATNPRRRIDIRGTDSDVEHGTFYPTLGDGNATVSLMAIVAIDPATDAPSDNYDKEWSEQLLLWAKFSSNDVLYRSPDGGRNWFLIYSQPASITGIIPTLTPYQDDKGTRQFSPSLLMTNVNGTYGTFSVLQGYGF